MWFGKGELTRTFGRRGLIFHCGFEIFFKKGGVDQKGVEKKSEGGLWPSKNYGFDTPFSLNANRWTNKRSKKFWFKNNESFVSDYHAGI